MRSHHHDIQLFSCRSLFWSRRAFYSIPFVKKVFRRYSCVETKTQVVSFSFVLWYTSSPQFAVHLYFRLQVKKGCKTLCNKQTSTTTFFFQGNKTQTRQQQEQETSQLTFCRKNSFLRSRSHCDRQTLNAETLNSFPDILSKKSRENTSSVTASLPSQASFSSWLHNNSSHTTHIRQNQLLNLCLSLLFRLPRVFAFLSSFSFLSAICLPSLCLMREHRGHKKRRYSRRTRRQHKHSCFHLCHHHLSSLDHKQRRHHWTLLDNDYVEHTHEGYTRRDEREEQEQQVKSCSNNTQAFLVIKLSSFIQKWLQPHLIQKSSQSAEHLVILD